MAFTENNFGPIGGENIAAPAHWSYRSAIDTLAETTAIGYFNDKINQLESGDNIYINASDSVGWYKVANDGDEITLTPVSDGGNSGVQSITGDGVDNNDPENPTLSFPDADQVDDTSTANKFVTQSEKDKLAGLESSKFVGEYVNLAALQLAFPTAPVGSYAYVDAGAGQDVEKYIWDNSDTAWVLQQGQSTEETPASIKTKYESNPDTNPFTDAEQTKLGNQSGTNTGDETTATIQAKRPLKTVGGESLEGPGNVAIPSGGVQSVTGDGVNNTDPSNPDLSFPDADQVDDSATTNKFVTQSEKNQISSNQSNIASVSSSLATLSLELDAAEAEIDQIQIDITNLQGTTSSQGSSISSNSSAITSLQTDLSSISGDVSDLQTDLSALQTLANNIDTDLTELETYTEYGRRSPITSDNPLLIDGLANVFETIDTYTFTVSDEDTYKISVIIPWRLNSAQQRALFEFELDGTVILEATLEPKDSQNDDFLFVFGLRDLTAGSHTVVARGSKTNDQTVLTIDGCSWTRNRIILEP
jgi:hypothetical protein